MSFNSLLQWPLPAAQFQILRNFTKAPLPYLWGGGSIKNRCWSGTRDFLTINGSKHVKTHFTRQLHCLHIWHTSVCRAVVPNLFSRDTNLANNRPPPPQPSGLWEILYTTVMFIFVTLLTTKLQSWCKGSVLDFWKPLKLNSNCAFLSWESNVPIMSPHWKS